MDDIEPQGIANLESAKHFVTTRFQEQISEVRSGVEPTDIESFDGFVASVTTSVTKMQISEEALKRMNEESLWFAFVRQVYKNFDYPKQLVARAAKSEEEVLQTMDSSDEILIEAGKVNYLRSGAIMGDLEASRKIIGSVEPIKQTVDEIFSEEADKGLVELLDSARDYITRTKPRESFVLLKVDGERRLGFGVRIEDGFLENVGIDHVTAPCRAYQFNTVIDSLEEVSPGIKLLPITHHFEDYPKHYFDPYELPADLFMLKSTAEWTETHLNATKVAQEIKENLSTNISS